MSSMPVSNSPPASNTQQIPRQKLAPKAAAAAPLPQTSRPQLLSSIYLSSSSSTGGADIRHSATTATTSMMLPALAVASATTSTFPDGRPIPSMPNASSSFPASTEDYQARMRQWHNHIGKKYRNKLNDKFESLQEVLVYVASNPDLNVQVAGTATGSTSSGSVRGASVGDADEDGDVTIMDGSSAAVSMSYAERLEVLRRMQEEEEELEDHELYDEDEDGAEDEDDDVESGRATARGSAPRRPRRRRTKGINKARMLAMARKTIVRLLAERDQLLRELAEAGNETD